MRISGSSPSGADWPRRESAVPARAAAQLPALVPIANRDSTSAQWTPAARPLSALVAQLVAGAENLPVARARRRADPAESAAIYRAVASLAPEAATTPRCVI
jgi:hypothetical protein